MGLTCGEYHCKLMSIMNETWIDSTQTSAEKRQSPFGARAKKTLGGVALALAVLGGGEIHNSRPVSAQPESEYAPDCPYGYESLWITDRNLDRQPGPGENEFGCVTAPNCVIYQFLPYSIAQKLAEQGVIDTTQFWALFRGSTSIGVCPGDSIPVYEDFRGILLNDNPWIEKVLADNLWIRDDIRDLLQRNPNSVYSFWATTFVGGSSDTSEAVESATPEDAPQATTPTVAPESSDTSEAVESATPEDAPQATTPTVAPESSDTSEAVESATPEDAPQATTPTVAPESSDTSEAVESATPEDAPQATTPTVAPESSDTSEAVESATPEDAPQATTPTVAPESSDTSEAVESATPEDAPQATTPTVAPESSDTSEAVESATPEDAPQATTPTVAPESSDTSEAVESATPEDAPQATTPTVAPESSDTSEAVESATPEDAPQATTPTVAVQDNATSSNNESAIRNIMILGLAAGALGASAVRVFVKRRDQKPDPPKSTQNS